MVTGEQIRDFRRDQVRRFVAAQDYADKRVLDYGCGAAPYRAIIETGGGEWVGYNRACYPGGPREDIGPPAPLAQRWDTIVCTEVLEYAPEPVRLLRGFRSALIPRGQLILTYPTNWPEVEPEDLYRFTRTGMQALLARWTVEQHEQLGSVQFGDRETLALGYGVVARP
jgi:SAM-dependent methyltransferase